MIRKLAPVFLVAMLYGPRLVYAGWALMDGARVHPDYHGSVPKKSDVVFSARRNHPEALDMIKAFGTTRVEWGYSVDKEFVASIKKITGWYGGSLNANAPLPDDEGMAKDFDGNTLAHPRMKAWARGGKWITTTHPETEQVLRAQAKKYLDLGVDSIQIDDPLLQLYSAYLWGGDFNPSTLIGFNKYLKTYPDKADLSRAGLADVRMDYREFLKSKYEIRDANDYRRRYKTLPSNAIWTKYLRQTVSDHFTEFKQFLNNTRRAAVPLSMNLGMLDRPDEKNWHFFLASLADYTISETPITNTGDLAVRAATLRALGTGYVPSLKPRGRGENRVAIATFYALGGQPVVPWDVYDGIDESGQAKRFFGTREEYGDLYRFVRKHPAMFDQKELAAVVGIPIPVDKFNSEKTLALTRQLVQRQVPFAFLLTGGSEQKFKLDPARARHFKLLVMANSEADFSPEDIKALRALPVSRIEAGQLTDATLRDLSPFLYAGESSALKLYPRASADGDMRNLLIHMVDEARGEHQSDDPTCRRRIGLKKNLIGNRRVIRATWYTSEAEAKLNLTETEREVYVSITGCALWGILSFDITPNS